MMNGQTTTIDPYLPIVVGVVLFGFLIVFILYFIVLYRKSQLRFISEKEELKQELLRAEIEIKEQTLNQVSREIHDNFGQVASLIKINLNLLSGELNEENQAKVEESLVLIKQLITDMKSLSRSLKGETLQQIGWINRIKTDVQQINRLGGLELTLNVNGTLEEMDRDQQLIFYRVVQEIFNNLLKHAQATEAGLSLSFVEQQFSLRYVDNGQGFDSLQPENKGSGLENMRERCRQIGAQFQLESRLGQGTRIEINC